MNNDLISREALRKIIETYRPTSITGDYLQGKNNMINFCLEEIDNAPAFEPASSDPTGDLIRREDLMKEIGKLSLAWEYGQGVSDCIKIIESVRSFYLPFCIKVNNVTDEDIQAIKDIMEDYRPQVLRLEDDRSNGTWINRGIVRECPECHCYCFLTIEDKIEGGELKFCPNCGTHLNKPEESAN